MTEKNENDPLTTYQAPQHPAAEESAPPRRAVPNIPRREPDSLPERPEGSGSSGRSGTILMLVLILILALVFFFLLKK